MRIKRVLFSSLMALALVCVWLLFCPVSAEADSSPVYSYDINNGCATIVHCSSNDFEITIPSVLDGYPVTAIGNEAFVHCNFLRSITIPDSITTIGYNAFGGTLNGAYSLKDVYINNPTAWCKVTGGSGLMSVYGATLHILDENGNEETNLIFDDAVTEIPSGKFKNCKALTNVFIPDSVTHIGRGAFSGCSNIESMTIPFVGDCKKADTDAYKYPFGYIFGTSSYDGGQAIEQRDYEVGGELTSSYFYIPETLRTVTVTGGNVISGAFENCRMLTSIVVLNRFTDIGDSAFSHCRSLTNITIPDGAQRIGNFAFSNCKGLTSIVIPDSVTSIGGGAFYDCDSLTSVTIPNSVTSIGNYAFRNCSSLTSVDIGNGVTSIGDNAFWDCDSLTSVTIPDSVTSIGDYAFWDCDSLTSVTIPDSVTSIGSSAFASCTGLICVTIPDGVISIGNSAFDSCRGLESITISNGVKNIGDSAFEDCSCLTSLAIPDSVTTIGSNAFKYCSLKDITIGNGVNEIGSEAFAGCPISNVYYAGNESKWNSISFEDDWQLSSATMHYNHIHDYTILPHIYSGATCIGEGYIVYQCSYGETYRQIIEPALGHDYSGKVTVVPPTCDAQGYTEKQCIRCTKTIKEEYTDSLGHKMVYAPATAPTCGTAGCTEGTVCERCGEMGVGMILPATGEHRYSNTWDTICNTCGGKRTVSLSNTAPTSFKAALTGYNDVKLTWKAGSGATHYYVYYRRAGKADWKRAGITTGLTYTIKDLVANGKYEFKVISYLKDSSGTYEGASTKVLTCSTTRNLKAPSKVTLKLYGYDDVKISWSKVTYAKGYKVYYKRSTAKSYSYVGFTTGTSIKKANLSDGVKYTFKVVPCTKVNGSYFADDSSKTTTVTTLKAVSTPKVAKYTSSKVKVSWTDISGESGYQIIVTSDKAGKKKVTTTTTTGKSKVVSAKKGVTYYYKVRAYKTVDGKKIYAPWSAAKAYKLK